MNAIDIDPGTLMVEHESLRNEVRAFIDDSLAGTPKEKRAKGWACFDPDFSRLLGAKGWIGMTWPKDLGGGGRSPIERYVVLEELLAAGAPMGAHWAADRQSGALLIRHSPDVLAPKLIPKMAKGELYFCIGMSEPESGSDLASIRTRARKRDDGWVINGRKVWTTGAHWSHYMIALVRTGEGGPADRHKGLSQFLIDMKTPGVTVSPVLSHDGSHDFNEVMLDDVWVPEECLIGKPGDGWSQVTAELALERSGPERYLSSTQLLLQMLDEADPGDERAAVEIGKVAAQYATLRAMSLGVTEMLASGANPELAAAVVKDQGAMLEQSIPELAHALFGSCVQPGSELAVLMKRLMLDAPAFSLRGGTREILRGIVARGLGLR